MTGVQTCALPIYREIGQQLQIEGSEDPAALFAEAERLWLLSEQAERLLTELHDQASTTGQLDSRIDPLASDVDALVERIGELLEQLPEPYRDLWLDQHRPATQDWANEILSDVEDMSLFAATWAMRRARGRPPFERPSGPPEAAPLRGARTALSSPS